MMPRISILILIGLLAGPFARSQSPITFADDIATIIYTKCTSCHRSGEIGPMALTNYAEISTWATMIKYVTAINYMPPWQPNKDYSTFVGENTLTDAEIQKIADWVDAGAPRGDPDREPALPTFSSGSQVGTPDLVLTMDEPYFIEGNNQDDYRVFVLPSGLTSGREIDAVEFRPGNSKAVHHALIAYDTTGAARALDAQTAEYGYESFGDFGVFVQGTFTGYSPGIQAVRFPPGIGTTLPTGADILIQVHYAPLPTDETDQSSLNIFFKDTNDPIVREVQRNAVTPLDLVGGWTTFTIPPDQVVTFHGTKSVTEDISLISVYPHSHYLGQDWELYAVTPQNDTVNIIHIDDWDFNWQGAYTFTRMQKIPENSVIHASATYDNTINNPFNPSNPPQSVTWGEGTTDEMYLVGIAFVPYQPGDENIVVVGTEPISEAPDAPLFIAYPNPSDAEITLNYQLDQKQVLRIDLCNAQGVPVKSIAGPQTRAPGLHQEKFRVDDLAAGFYTIRLRGGNLNLTKPLLVTGQPH